ncbi:FAD-dependent oxidoreductase [Actinomadura rubrisoli]|uniref:FAD-dependent monooxygenase n=1 Tax=Actinomadura rubrisoli TaxID=2530368 RepID=A0A4R5C557_9ACTN|nr:FAD-dependent monooxygenase [Actinomadura rubrisoli]TDD94778.1 FAD-dependent monooxygenase [Actinomadura rubrisoli]
MTAIRTALVIGGGIAGPVAALALRKAGIQATVFEAHPGEANAGASLTVAPNGLNALEIIGAADAVRAAGRPIPGMAMGDGRGNRFAEFSGLPGLPASHVFARADLNRALHDYAASQGVEIEHGKRFVGAEETAGAVTARFADGSTAAADILIGADGIRSAVRPLIDPAAPSPEYVGLIGLAGFASGSGVEPDPDVMYFAFGDRAFLGYWAMPDGRVAWFSNVPEPDAAVAAAARKTPPGDWLERLRDLYADDVPGAALLRHSEPGDLFVLGGMEIMPDVPSWHRGRMVLVGDSAHAPSPSSGQGASLAIESAVELARCLRDLPGAPAAFAAYERLRRPRVQAIAAAAARTNEDKSSGGPAGPVDPEQIFGFVHRHRVDWDERVTP